MTRSDYCPVAQEPCQAVCYVSGVRCVIRDGRPVPAPQPAPATQQAPAQRPLTDEQIQDLLGIGNPTEEECRLIRLGWEAANCIGGEKP